MADDRFNFKANLWEANEPEQPAARYPLRREQPVRPFEAEDDPNVYEVEASMGTPKASVDSGKADAVNRAVNMRKRFRKVKGGRVSGKSPEQVAQEAADKYVPASADGVGERDPDTGYIFKLPRSRNPVAAINTSASAPPNVGFTSTKTATQPKPVVSPSMQSMADNTPVERSYPTTPVAPKPVTQTGGSNLQIGVTPSSTALTQQAAATPVERSYPTTAAPAVPVAPAVSAFPRSQKGGYRPKPIPSVNTQPPPKPASNYTFGGSLTAPASPEEMQKRKNMVKGAIGIATGTANWLGDALQGKKSPFAGKPLLN